MALVITGPTRQVAIAEDGEPIFSSLAATLGIPAPICDRIWDRFYASPHLDAAAVASWRSELVALREGWELRRAEELVRERKIRAADPAVVAQIVAPMLAADRTLAICDELIALCDDAVHAGRGLHLDSD